jgi:hypothetical protein
MYGPQLMFCEALVKVVIFFCVIGQRGRAEQSDSQEKACDRLHLMTRILGVSEF